MKFFYTLSVKVLSVLILVGYNFRLSAKILSFLTDKKSTAVATICQF